MLITSHGFKKRSIPRRIAVTILAAVVLALTGCNNPVEADTWSQQAQEVDALFADIDVLHQPGCSVGVINDGEFIHRGNYGAANLEYNIPLSSKSIFRMGSVSKQFTAAAIVLLAEQGKLSLDADVHEYLPDLMDYGYPVTLRQMLWHTSGMADYEGDGIAIFINMFGEAFRWGDEDYMTIPEFRRLLAQVPLRTAPDTEFYYSNSAYFLLSQVVEEVSGQSLSEFAAANIFEPLQMTASSFYDDVNRLVPLRATGYRKTSSGPYEIYETNLDWVGDGGVYTSIDDFIHWDQNFYHNILGNTGQQLVELMETPSAHGRTKEGDREFGYGFGLESSIYKGSRRVGHSGEWVAFNTHYARFPDLSFSVVTLCNTLEVDASDKADQIIDIYLPTLQAAAQK
jgi:CubicO group peptidase (beta-lactamase class C family)